MSSRQPSFAQLFQTALLEFRELREQQTRLSACGQEFVLVNNVTARLRERSESCPTQYQDDLDRLGQTAYLREGPQPPQLRTHHIRNHLAIFYNLLDIGAPSLIHEFRNNNLATLPIDIDVLKKHIKGPPDDPNFHDKFYRNQFMWCPIQFEMDMGITHSHDIISPFSRKEEIKPYRDGKGPRANTATLYAIDVPEELVGPKLQKKMASAKIERQDGGTDSCGNRGKVG
ncbi:protein kinase domain-containing protein [Colletotrichum tofieldiae]|nr:protein kinase domain-containing protein [Colletotrichum tofieldiae]